jgi:NAD(P)-dependent dehydrogenase (short-subunit alcohol dehydrogenase family)
MKTRTVLITGANRGLGLGLARVYLDDGWRVIALNRSSSPELQALDNGQLDIRCCDLTNDAELAAVADSLAGQALDVLIHNAGRNGSHGFDEKSQKAQSFGHFDREVWHQVFDINLFTAMSLAELLVDNLALSSRGRIVTISSMLGSMTMNDNGGSYAYRASKAGVNSIMKSMSVDLAQRGIIATAQHPGWVRTDMGGSAADIDVETSITGMKAVIDGLSMEDSGKFISYDGGEMPW